MNYQYTSRLIFLFSGGTSGSNQGGYDSNQGIADQQKAQGGYSGIQRGLDIQNFQN